MDESSRPETFFRRLLWKNSGILCLVMLITLPIILGVAIGYVIVLGILTSYRKITGQKSREEKEDEAAKKIRIVLGHELLDSAITKPEKLPGQRHVTRMPGHGAVGRSSSVLHSRDGNESHGEAINDDEAESRNENEGENGEEIENIQERANEFGISGNSVETHESSAESSQAANKMHADSSRAANKMHADSSRAANELSTDNSRAVSTSSEYYSTASEMEEPTERCHGDDASAHVPRENRDEKSEATSSASLQMSNTNILPQESVPMLNRNEMPSTSQVKPFMSPGKLKYSVEYLKDRNQLQVTILKAINLSDATREPHQPTSFVKVCLLPQRFCWQRTKAVERTRNPVYNETFVISGFSHERFSAYTLLICVVDAALPWQGRYGDNLIGEIHVPLMRFAKDTEDGEKGLYQWTELKPKMAETPGLSKCGKINLALCYRSISGRLIVTIKKAKDLKCQNREKFDPYVKLALYCDGTRVGRRATRVKRRVTTPVFNEKFNFDLTSDQIAHATLVVKIVNNINESTPACVGATVIGYESSGDGQEHWLCMMECLSQHVDAWHVLYD